MFGKPFIVFFLVHKLRQPIGKKRWNLSLTNVNLVSKERGFELLTKIRITVKKQIKDFST
jgi:hypothetical protein